MFIHRVLLVISLFALIFVCVPAYADDGPMGTLVIASIQLYKPIEYIPLINRAYDLTELGYGVGFLDDTSWNDTAWGRTVLVGHTPGGFENLTNVKIGDRIILMTDTFVLEYQVYATTIVNANADPRDWFTPTDTPTLLLQTCYGEDRLMIEAALESYH